MGCLPMDGTSMCECEDMSCWCGVLCRVEGMKRRRTCMYAYVDAILLYRGGYVTCVVVERVGP